MSVTPLKQRIEKPRLTVSETPAQRSKPTPAKRVNGYSAEYKANAIALVIEQKMSRSAAARKMDIVYATMDRWICQHDAAHARASAVTERKQQASERRQHMCEAIGLLKQAIDRMHAACNPVSKKEKPL